MNIRPASDHGNDLRHTEFGALLNRPLHPIELEDCKQEGDVRWIGRRHLCSELKLDTGIRDVYDSSTPDLRAGADVEFLPDPRTKHPNQMSRVITRKRGLIP